MMILGKFKLCALGALLAAMAAPSFAAAAAESTVTMKRQPAAPATGDAPAGQARRVELPFPLESRTSDNEPQAAPRRDAGPHPFRDGPFKRAALTGPDSGAEAIDVRRLSRFPEFS